MDHEDAKLSADRVRELRELAQRPDSEIDCSNIPEIRKLPPNAVIGRFHRPKKTSLND